jgi:hypothetical protein
VPRSVACAVVRGVPPHVFIAESQEVLNWVIALHLIAATPGHKLDEGFRRALRDALRDEQWGDAVELWMQNRLEIDVYPSYELYTEGDVELAALELEFTPLFRD